ncbi:hypothetical protein M422DRAFT_258412 [Sphaerobolus stellatus SS14]|uniref:RRM domain-containing protein n=1 Tax=Sphaerobolus stellatus (strain SS14) TaxID=990650 RepID=A0A0C9VM75_SPHS4|nr:hypothetical protein M422DRAFT_258412 [Sphaerobolus stellatus SS14]
MPTPTPTTNTANPTPIATTNANAQQQPTITPSQSQSTVSSLLHLRPLALRYSSLHFDASTSTWNNTALSPRSVYKLMQYPSSLSGCHRRRLLDQHPESSPTRRVNRTTKVYINGLPPHFKAEQLYALASQFGTVLSCRTFIRQLSDHPLGYGFVLFDTVDAAQKCIDVLRSHHNLHPTFSKVTSPQNRALAAPHQYNEPASVRRRLRPRTRARAFYITSYPHLGLGSSTLNSSIGMTMGIGGVVGGGAMGGEEVGGDVYIEGLPMNIDVPTLRVLVASHVIHRSRFFADTRLQLPQLVAYIQFDNRAVAQDVRNKLHGRSIRGYGPTLLPTPTTPQDKLKYTNNNNVGGSGNVHNATGARRGHPNTNVNANGNGVGGGGGHQSQRQSPEGVAVGGTGGLSRMSMGGYGISFEPLHTLQGLGVGARYTIQPTPGTGSTTVPPPLQPISTTLSQLQMQLESLCPLLAAYTNTNNANTTPDTTSDTTSNSTTTNNDTTTNNGININLHSHNAQSQSHSNPTSPHLQSVPIPMAIQIPISLPPPLATPSTTIPTPTPIRRPSLLIVRVI